MVHQAQRGQTFHVNFLKKSEISIAVSKCGT